MGKEDGWWWLYPLPVVVVVVVVLLEMRGEVVAAKKNWACRVVVERSMVTKAPPLPPLAAGH